MTRKKSSQISDQEWDEDIKISYNSVKRKNLIIGLMDLIVIIVGAGIAYAAVSLSFKETGPPISGGTLPALSGCDPLTATPSGVPTGSSGGVLFTCGPQGTMLGALTVNSPVNASLSYSPAPIGYTAIYIISHGSLCSLTTTSNMQIFGGGSQTTFQFTTNGQYDYCGIVQNVPASGLPSWMITWTWTQTQ